MSNDNRGQGTSAGPLDGCLSEEAAYWYFLSLDSRGMSASERREFLTWLRRSAVHIAELLRIAELHGKLRQLKGTLRSLDPGTSDPP